ncbi:MULTISPECIES: helix-turn-helix domain-containing protein [Dysgonomonas]|uniref:Helix-turn-helix domain-containing protein n=1 Tax=Dysgonomonas gadei ATCC BAA-286 TaxID=742766 RepID=F5IX97_9BACT|nr:MULTISPECIES: helix-turn-helix domain-containing protein [Dysgonomonas]EGK02080.1 hypothetical protein HMPREF9455_01714 [Dysgonomonas gadei ATCC BAA-286]MBF0650878.1 helix-turn-helix domain-containing protein [Dysgonomonas sp. GY75]
MEILNKKSDEIVSFLSVLDESLDSIKVALTNRTPHLNGEKYLTNNDVSKLLNISIRSLQDWRDNGTVGYIQISGKILYRQSDILKLLEDNYEKSWRED